MISGEGDIKFDSFTGRFFNDIGPGSLKQNPVTGDMWFDNGNFMECPFTIQKVTDKYFAPQKQQCSIKKWCIIVNSEF